MKSCLSPNHKNSYTTQVNCLIYRAREQFSKSWGPSTSFQVYLVAGSAGGEGGRCRLWKWLTWFQFIARLPAAVREMSPHSSPERVSLRETSGRINQTQEEAEIEPNLVLTGNSSIYLNSLSVLSLRLSLEPSSLFIVERSHASDVINLRAAEKDLFLLPWLQGLQIGTISFIMLMSTMSSSSIYFKKS